jgi:hypothetical protein
VLLRHGQIISPGERRRKNGIGQILKISTPHPEHRRRRL